MKRLGYGMMRLPTTGPKEHAAVDLEQVCRLVDAFMGRGFSYFDTAYFYHEGQSEHIVRQAVAERHSRDRFLLADKMPMMHLKGKTAKDQARIFDDQLQKCGVDYFDYYLLHCLDRNSYEAAKELDTFSFLMGKKAEGRLRHLGFSFHDRAEVLDRILTEHPEAEFVQLQLNYLDWEDGTVQSRLCYETAVRHGKKVIVMEPVRGGRLAKLPEEAEALLRQAHPDWSNASWAIRFAAGLEHVMMVLSGMSDLDQVLDNTAAMATPPPLPRRRPPCWPGARRSLPPPPSSPAPPAVTAWRPARRPFPSPITLPSSTRCSWTAAGGWSRTGRPGSNWRSGAENSRTASAAASAPASAPSTSR